MHLDHAKRIGALLVASVLIGCGGGSSSTMSDAEAALAARQAAAMTNVTPVPRECATE